MLRFISDWNKKRLYIAFYGRNPSPAQSIPFHTALLLTPKHLSGRKEDEDSSIRYQAAKELTTEDGNVRMGWKYQAEKTFARTR